ncbi:Alginate export [Desulfurobacterium pacificum]|uniref:Alginate export n=1 Tax=Desulfurobacterium pacificum TaxID=240166 RepID=A0ABY1NHS1_9BACT|nr:alginate export family protein [Desulfurobacterium pacificum]SMP10199.1 Alginate export [Desulfurobacterium pacificum]
MRKALKVATLMGLAAALIVPAAPSAKAADMDMGSTKVTIGGQLRERLEWYASEAGSGTGDRLAGTYRARIKIKAQLSDGVTAVFVPQSVGIWGTANNGEDGKYGVGLDNDMSVGMHEAYMLLANPFGINNVIVKIGRQEVNLGNQRLVGSVGWSQAGRSLDGILVGYVAGDYGLAGFFYGKLNDNGKQDAWFRPAAEDLDGTDIDLYVATWQGKFKPFGIGGTYELTDIYVNKRGVTFTTGDASDALDFRNVNTLYGRITPVFNTDFAKVKVNLEGAIQGGDAGVDITGKDRDFSGYFFSVGAGADFANVNWTPGVFVGYDYYSGDSDDQGDIDSFWSVLPTAHKWLGHADIVWLGNVYKFNGAIASRSPGVKDLYLKLSAKPLAKVALGLDLHYFKTAEDYAVDSTTNTYGVKPAGFTGKTSDDIGWEADFSVKYKYSKNLCLSLGWDHFDPDSDFAAAYINPDHSTKSDAEDHIWAQADLKF